MKVEQIDCFVVLSHFNKIKVAGKSFTWVMIRTDCFRVDVADIDRVRNSIVERRRKSE
jgi:hypothetical protein